MARFCNGLPFEEKFDNRVEMINLIIIYITLMSQYAMADPAVNITMLDVFTEFYSYAVYLGTGFNLMIAAYATYGNIADYRE